MSGIAEILLALGFKVSGSDQKCNEACKRLEERGASISYSHVAENVPESATMVVYSSAVSKQNPELVIARERGIPVIRRAEVLAELMRLKYGVGVAGSHGKTTTTSMTAAILEEGGLDPTVIIGGKVKSIGTGGKLGRGDVLVAETDESDRSFLLLRPTVAIVTNIDSEHLNAYASYTELEQSFEQFVCSVPFYGLSVLCIDDPKVRDIAARINGRKVTYGISPDAMIRAENITPSRDGSKFDVFRAGEFLCSVQLAMLGKHMAINSLAAIAVGLEFGVPVQKICRALSNFGGVGRRLEIIGEPSGIVVINDYGHHPTEVKATISAVRSGWGGALRKLHVIFQPHRYTRTQDCFAQFLDAFVECDNLIVTDIYSAGEEPIEGISGEVLAKAINHPSCNYVDDLSAVPNKLLRSLEAGDVVICLGAGSIGSLPEKLIAAIEGKASLAKAA